jgi:hypothetical protein
MTLGIHLLYPLKPCRDCIQIRNGKMSFFSLLVAFPTPFFHFITFLYLLSTCLELRGYGKWNCQRARNRGVLRQAKCFLHMKPAGQEQVCCRGMAPGPELNWDSFEAQGLAGGSLSQHVYTFCPRLFSRIAPVILGR